MAERYTNRGIFGVYRQVFRRHPLILWPALFLSIFAYLVLLQALGLVDLTFPFGFARPELHVGLRPTEEYPGVVVKRVIIENGKRILRSVRITIHSPSAIEEIKIMMDPEMTCRSELYRSSEDVALFDISCDSFASGQTVELALYSTTLAEASGTVVVEVVATDEQGRAVGTSATGSIQLDGSN